MSNRLRTTSWILLVVIGSLTLLGGLGSLWVAYATDVDQLGGSSLRDLAGDRADVVTAVRARRATAAAYACGFAALFLFVAAGPYRRGERWSWWALLVSTLAMALPTLLRVPLLGTRAGTGTALLVTLLVGLALALDARRLKPAA